MEMPLTDTGSLGETGSWLVRDRRLKHGFKFGHFVVEMPIEHPSQNSHCVMAYINLEFRVRLELTTNISMSTGFSLEKIAKEMELNGKQKRHEYLVLRCSNDESLEDKMEPTIITFHTH